jgi:tetratricopeptide (TPR) repeat protein
MGEAILCRLVTGLIYYLLSADFLQEENITPRTLILLALILTRCKEKPRQFLGKTLLFSASAIGEPSATIFLIDSALKNKQLDSPLYTAPFTHLRTLAAPPHCNIEAMVLLGKIYRSQGDKGMALQLFRQAASIKTSSTQEGMDSQMPLPGVASALVHIGIILEDQGNKSDAKDAFRKAALEHDDSTGYYHLARMEEELSETQWTYLLKSAASGNLNAAVRLGEMHQIRARLPNGFESAMKERQMAKEWHYLSALAGKTDSTFHLIIMFTQEDKMQSALKWMEMAENSPRESVAKAIKKLREDLESGKLREDIKNGKYDRELKGDYFITKRDDDTRRGL